MIKKGVSGLTFVDSSLTASRPQYTDKPYGGVLAFDGLANRCVST